jgi:hypothetical protein
MPTPEHRLGAFAVDPSGARGTVMAKTGRAPRLRARPGAGRRGLTLAPLVGTFDGSGAPRHEVAAEEITISDLQAAQYPATTL